jgi:hypothetical protein
MNWIDAKPGSRRRRVTLLGYLRITTSRQEFLCTTVRLSQSYPDAFMGLPPSYSDRAVFPPSFL